jgi:hypothetical protein
MEPRDGTVTSSWCPTCEAAPFAPCRRPSGLPCRPHEARYEAAARDLAAKEATAGRAPCPVVDLAGYRRRRRPARPAAGEGSAP